MKSKMEQSIMSTPYGDLKAITPKIADSLVYVSEKDLEFSNFKPPSAWMVRDATGGRMYFKCRGRAKAQEMADIFYGKGKYGVINDKPVQVR